MSLFKIAWRNMQQRGLASLLTMFSMALGICLVVLVLSIGWLIQATFSRNSNVGYNLIVGSKGSPLQLTLNTVFYLSKPIEVLPYDDYLEFLPQEERVAEIKRIGGEIAEPERAGRFGAQMKGGFAIPVCLGDYYGRFRVVGTKPEFFEKLRYGESSEFGYEFAAGRNMLDHSPEHGFFEAVLGSHVANEMNIKVGDVIRTTHGNPEGEGHGEGFTVVGILRTTGTPNDRACFINLEGFYFMDGHARAIDPEGLANQERTHVERDPNLPERLRLEKRDVTAILVKPANGMAAMGMEWEIKKSARAQAASPIREITTMLEDFVSPINDALLALTGVVCLVSAISILVSIYNSMNERRRDIAVMRALGARRDVVMLVVLIESLLIAFIGGVMGWLSAHVIGLAFSPMVEYRTGIRLGLLTSVTTYELLLIPGLILLATIAGLIPAMAAYRTDVSRNLSA